MRQFLIVIVQFYNRLISPFLSPSCRFQPTCSKYAIEALEERTILVACWLIIRRLSKCHPWGGSGFDPVPKSSN